MENILRGLGLEFYHIWNDEGKGKDRYYKVVDSADKVCLYYDKENNGNWELVETFKVFKDDKVQNYLLYQKIKSHYFMANINEEEQNKGEK